MAAPTALLRLLLTGTALIVLLHSGNGADMCGPEPTVIHVAKGEKKHVKYWNSADPPTPPPSTGTDTLEICSGHQFDSSDGSGCSSSSSNADTPTTTGSPDSPKEQLLELSALSAMSAISSEAVSDSENNSDVTTGPEASTGLTDSEKLIKGPEKSDGIESHSPFTLTAVEAEKEQRVPQYDTRPDVALHEAPNLKPAITDRVVSHTNGADVQEVTEAEPVNPATHTEDGTVEGPESSGDQADDNASELQKAISPIVDENNIEGSGKFEILPPSASLPLNKYQEIRIPSQDDVASDVILESSGDFAAHINFDELETVPKDDQDRRLQVKDVTDDMVLVEWTPDEAGSGLADSDLPTQSESALTEGSGADSVATMDEADAEEGMSVSLSDAGFAGVVGSSEPEVVVTDDELLPLKESQPDLQPEPEPQVSETIYHVLSSLPLSRPTGQSAGPDPASDRTADHPDQQGSASGGVSAEERLLLVQALEGDRVVLEHIPEEQEGSGGATYTAFAAIQSAEDAVEGSGHATQDEEIEASGQLLPTDEKGAFESEEASGEAPVKGGAHNYVGINPPKPVETWVTKEEMVAGVGVHLSEEMEAGLKPLSPAAVVSVKGPNLAEVEKGAVEPKLPIAEIEYIPSFQQNLSVQEDVHGETEVAEKIKSDTMVDLDQSVDSDETAESAAETDADGDDGLYSALDADSDETAAEADFGSDEDGDRAASSDNSAEEDVDLDDIEADAVESSDVTSIDTSSDTNIENDSDDAPANVDNADDDAQIAPSVSGLDRLSVLSLISDVRGSLSPLWTDFTAPLARRTFAPREPIVVGLGPYLELYTERGGRHQPHQRHRGRSQSELEVEKEPESNTAVGRSASRPSKPEQQLTFNAVESVRNTDDQLFRFIRSQPYPFVSAFLHGTSSRGSRRATQAVECEWQIKTDPHLYLLVTVNNLSAPYTVDCDGAYIEVEREGNGFEARWCGNRIKQSGSRPHMVFARGEVRIAVFNDGNTTQLPTGFDADVEVVDLLDSHQYTTFRRSGLNFRRLIQNPVLPLP